MSTRLTLPLLLLLAPSALAQDDAPPGAVSEEWRLSFDLGFDAVFETDIDGPGAGDVERSVFLVGIEAERELTPTTRLSLRGGYRLDGYEFGGANPLGLGGGDPWEDVHTWGGALILDAALDDGWALYGGPVVQVSREGSLDPGGAITAGGLIGARRTVSERLVIGGGIGVMSQLEDSDPRFFPSVILHWQLHDNWRLASSSAGLARSGIELIWHAGDQSWEAALGAGYETRRFRLDDTAPVVDGIAEDTSLPVWLRVTFRPDANTDLTLRAGLLTAGELVVENSSGGHVVTRDYDGTFFVGASVGVRF